jgi:hypothetical protein
MSHKTILYVALAALAIALVHECADAYSQAPAGPVGPLITNEVGAGLGVGLKSDIEAGLEGPTKNFGEEGVGPKGGSEGIANDKVPAGNAMGGIGDRGPCGASGTIGQMGADVATDLLPFLAPRSALGRKQGGADVATDLLPLVTTPTNPERKDNDQGDTIRGDAQDRQGD